MNGLFDAISALRPYDLAQPMENGMTSSPNHPGFRMALARRHGDKMRADGTSAASEMIVTGGHVGTHIDALSHFSDHDNLYGNVPASAAQQTGRFTVHGVDSITPMVCRGVLFDIAATTGEQVLPAAFPIDAELLALAANKAQLEIRKGDVALVRTGWDCHFCDAQTYLGEIDGAPGITTDAASWLADHNVVAIGSDTAAVERIPAGQGHSLLPVHKLLLVERGIHLIENLALAELAAAGIVEFLFVATPLKIVGGTGSPLRPLALAP